MTWICPLVAAQVDDGNWIFELDRHGTVLHASRQPFVEGGAPMTVAEGSNLFDDVNGLNDKERLRDKFKHFLRSDRAMDSFCLGPAAGMETQTKVTLVRTFDTGPHSTSPLVMMEIKRNAH